MCAQNKIRSLTAEKMFAHSQRYQVRSRGISNEARIKLTESDIFWADLIFVMEKNHKNRIMSTFREAVDKKEIVCLFIEDVYTFMDPALVEELRSKLSEYIEFGESDD